ncbi:MAG: class I SAM-dependent methyltransferase [Bacteroidia bacterium]|nr:class I SAM-dependent methyltransferase [Bacteroidia bacterium]
MPKSLKKRLRKHFKSSESKGDLKTCSVCKQTTIIKKFPYHQYFEKFYEHGFVYSPFQFETLNLKHYRCSNCGASDRERLIALYFSKNDIGKQKEILSMVDFAPTKALQPFFKSLDQIDYRSADLFMENVDDKVDLTNMHNYKDNSFDLFVCSHILEHIVDDTKAMKELYRITKQNGSGLCLVPILLSIDKSVENEEYREHEHLRWKYFGQDDHVRMYAKKDFVSRLEAAGFQVNQYGSDYFGQDVFDTHGIDQKSVLYVVKK